MPYAYLNLIPEIHKKVLQRERTFFLVHNVVGLLVVVLALNGMLLIMARFILVNHAKELKNENSLVNPGHSTLQHEIKRINNQLEDTARIQEHFTKWSALLADFTTALPEGVTIDFLNISADSKTFRITGVAKNRDSLLSAKESLESLPMVATLASPLSNFIEKENSIFRFSGTLNSSNYGSSSTTQQ
ncbi:hypothetical protein BK004_02670 [bacterium CG10_46_32]|nr:MAG: hypothetical protein BK004_02670 [bacterium CG10_46_32]PIR56105.1 MAG: hypothetical protein COU73_02695 [Parcubacteria group bacterium CG10_big_fil_rev_8_21_14_0_10_46_32]